MLMGTWVNNKKWAALKDSWKKGFNQDMQEAIVSKGRGRTKGGILVGLKEGIESGKRGKWDVEGWVKKEIKLGEEWWWIVGVYVNGDLARKKELFGKWMEEVWERHIIIGGGVSM